LTKVKSKSFTNQSSQVLLLVTDDRLLSFNQNTVVAGALFQCLLLFSIACDVLRLLSNIACDVLRPFYPVMC